MTLIVLARDYRYNAFRETETSPQVLGTISGQVTVPRVDSDLRRDSEEEEEEIPLASRRVNVVGFIARGGIATT